MTADPGPYALDETRLILSPEGSATPKAVTPSFYQELAEEFGGFKGHVLISRHAFDEPWESWEMHPKGDEIVYLLDGDVSFILWLDGHAKTLHVREPGACLVVPQGVWHTARPHAPSRMLFITPGEGTQHAEAPPGEGT